MIHPYLAGLRLFEADTDLNRRLAFALIEWQRDHSRLDIRKEIAWSHSWLIENHTRRKNYIRYIGNWLRIAERNFGPGRHPALNKLPPPPHYEVEENELFTHEDWKRLREAIK